MCYSAQIWQAYQRYVRAWGAAIDMDEFVRLYWLREQGAKVRIAKGMDAAFAEPQSEAGQRIHAMIAAHDAAEASRLEQEVFRQRKRLADAERALRGRTTKKALEDQRIAPAKIAWALDKLADLRRTSLEDRDARIFPGWHAPVMVAEGDGYVVRPMRYQCRPAGKPASYDHRYPGTYNARRDNLEGFWQPLFGYAHGLVVASAFFENVSRHRVEGRELAEGEAESNVVLEFRPRPPQDMLIACLWSRWQQGDEVLYSFAAVTDEPPAEVAAAGHDRCIIPIKPDNVAAWLRPDAQDLAAQYAILDDRARPYYEHRQAA